MPQELSNPSEDAALVAQFSSALTNMFKKDLAVGVSIDPSLGIVVDPGTPPDSVKIAVHGMHKVSRRNKEQRRLIDRYIGQLICAFSATANCDWTEAISSLDLVEATGNAFKTLVKLPRIVSILPDEAYALPGLSTSHYDAATSFAGPPEEDQMAKFNEGRMRILREASEAPDDRPKGWVINEMRKLQQEFGVESKRKTNLSDTRKAYEVCSQALLEWTDEDYESFGVTRAQLRDRWEGYKAELIDRGLLSDNSSDPITFTLPWRVQEAPQAGEIQDAEFTPPGEN